MRIPIQAVLPGDRIGKERERGRKQEQESGESSDVVLVPAQVSFHELGNGSLSSSEWAANDSQIPGEFL